MARRAFVMAGGAGERFWPLSRAKRPKQLLRLTDPNRSLLQEAVERIEPLVGTEGVFVITGQSLAQPIAESQVVRDGHVWVEPARRNTLGALVWVAAQSIANGHGDDTLAILTADHKIDDEEAFRTTVRQAMELAEGSGSLVVCGILPSRAETGYGYIELGPIAEDGSFDVESFREKPGIETAEKFVASGNFLWNSGMFFWTVGAFSAALSRANPTAHASLERIASALQDGDLRAATIAFEELPSISIDFGLMEHADDVKVVRGTFGWDDVGAWDALPRTIGADANGNVELGATLAIDCKDVVLYNDSTLQTMAAVGLSGIVAVATDDAILLCPIDKAQRVKEIVEKLKTDDSTLL